MEYKGIITIENEIEAQLLKALLDNEKIPHLIRSYHNPIYDGIFQLQKGWGTVFVPEQYEERVKIILKGIRNPKNYNTILFDLDGTIIDSEEGIVNSVVYALDKLGIVEKDKDKLRLFIGPPLKDSFMKIYNFDEDKALEAIQYYREYYSKTGIFQCQLYPSIDKLLRELHKNRRKSILATSKPTIYAKKILEKYDVLKYFDLIVGSELDGNRSNKVEVIRFVLDKLPAKTDDVLMVGDRVFDIEGAKDCKIDSLAVTYGFGSLSEILRAKPDYIVNSVEELRLFLLKNILPE